MTEYDEVLQKILRDREFERRWMADHPSNPEFDISPINWDLLTDLGQRPHPVFNKDFMERVRETEDENGRVRVPAYVLGEMTQEIVAVHHLLDMLGVPCPLPSVGGAGHPADLDARAWRAVAGALALQEQLGRIADWHSRETFEAGMVGDLCVECHNEWPCETYEMATGAWKDPDDDDELPLTAVMADFYADDLQLNEHTPYDDEVTP